MENYEIRTSCDELLGAGNTVYEAVKSALLKISVDEFIEYGTYCDEITEGIFGYSCFELYDIAAELDKENAVQ